MASASTAHEEPFVRIRLVNFSDGIQIHPLKNLNVRVATIDINQITANPSKLALYDEKLNCIYFKTRTIPNRLVTISISIDKTKSIFVHRSTIEDLIRHADEVIREYRLTNKGQVWMSIKLIIPQNLREARRSAQCKIRNHYGHEFLPKYFNKLPGFCSDCKKMIWGYSTAAYRCQLCDLVVHEQCINNVTSCQRVALTILPEMAASAHNFQREPNFLSGFCDHDGKIIPPLAAWKCSECGIVVHSKCKANVAQFCGTHKIAVQFYEKWKENNKNRFTDSYLSSNDFATIISKKSNEETLVNLYERLQITEKRSDASKDLNRMTDNFKSSNKESQRELISSAYYNTSTIFLHDLSFHDELGHGMSGSVYKVKHFEKSYALKAIRKHRIFEADELECVQNERNTLELCRGSPFIIQLFAAFHDFERVYFLLEFAPCGNFYEFLVKYGSKFNEVCIKWFSGQIICAIRYLHSKLVIHRDIKPENLLLMSNGSLKLADFGFTKTMKSTAAMTRTFCGTAEYIAPEIYQRMSYSFPVDYWSIGIMIYEMITLKTPFYHETESNLRNNIIHTDFRQLSNTSSQLQSLLNGLLTKNPSKRFGLEELDSAGFYSSPYSLDEIEWKKVKSPWQEKIPLNPVPNVNSSSHRVQLSHIAEESLCATLTVKEDNFRNFTFFDL